jgi:hypothetical protein
LGIRLWVRLGVHESGVNEPRSAKQFPQGRDEVSEGRRKKEEGRKLGI